MMWHSFLDGRLGLVKVMLMMWTPCMLREFNLVGCSYIVIIDESSSSLDYKIVEVTYIDIFIVF
jgi:hypothetical protein